MRQIGETFRKCYNRGMSDLCAVCGKDFRLLSAHARRYECIICHKTVGAGCFKDASIQDGREGPVCDPCWPSVGNRAVEGGTLLPAKTLMELRRQVEIVRDDLIRQLRELKQDVNSDVGALRDEVKRDVDAYMGRLDQIIRGWMEEANRSVEKHLRRAFAYLWIVLCSTAFLTIVGMVYYQMLRTQNEYVNPITLFRLAMVVLVIIPWSGWLVSALVRAARTRSFAEYRQGRKLSLRDYLFGFLYFNDPVENLWGPVAIIGSAFALLIYLLINAHRLFA